MRKLLLLGLILFVVASPARAYLIGQDSFYTSTITYSGVSNVVLQRAHITTSSGNCIVITGGSSNITIRRSYFTNCGTDASTSGSNGIFINGDSSANISDNYFTTNKVASGCSPFSHGGVEVLDNNAAVVIQGNVFAFHQTQVLAYNSSQITTTGNYGINPIGPGCNPSGGGSQVQYYADGGTLVGTGTIADNYFVSNNSVSPNGLSEDALSVGGDFSNYTVSGNYVLGGQSSSGCAMTADSGAYHGTFTDNIANYYNCALQITNCKNSSQTCTTGGVNNTATGNKLLATAGGVNGAALVTSTNGIGGNVCGPTTIQNNTIAGVVLTNGSWYNDTTCNPVTQSGNTVDTGCTNGVDCTAYAALNPITSTNPPPLIPPSPVSCVIKTPYSTQTSKPYC